MSIKCVCASGLNLQTTSCPKVAPAAGMEKETGKMPLPPHLLHPIRNIRVGAAFLKLSVAEFQIHFAFCHSTLQLFVLAHVTTLKTVGHGGSHSFGKKIGLHLNLHT